ncbi:MAG TPA: hypothetical protein H9902_10995 [Candidatus Stackebrandtia faecavium]|nr:hypothetical protein [Candidatus Stackebrandtia faecavium]
MATLKTGNKTDMAHAQRQRSDLMVWLTLLAAGMVATVLAVATDARLDSAAPPFLGRYELAWVPASMAAPIVAATVLLVARTRWAQRASWRRILVLAYLGSAAWLVGLAQSQPNGLTAYLTNRDGYLPQADSIGTLPELFATFGNTDSLHSSSVTGHPPGTVVMVWLLNSLPMSHTAAALVWIAFGALSVPLILSVARTTCGHVAARALAPVLVLAPYGIWIAVGPEGLTITVAAAGLAAANHASHHRQSGWSAAIWALVAGLLLAAATMFAYITAWFGLSVACLYFARRRPFHNLATGLGALLPFIAFQLAGFDWTASLLSAYEGYLSRVDDDRSVGWWIVLSLVVALFAMGPAIVASLRKTRNTPAWPFLIGSGAAVMFSICMGIARGGVEETWLPLFPWLMIAATAPQRPAGRPVPAPLLLAGGGAVAAIILQSVLVSPW